MDAEHSAGKPLEVALTVESVRYDPDDARWGQQVGQLVGELTREVGTVRVVSEPQPGSKGGPEAIILALGSAGAFTAAIQVFRAWLARERSRQLTVTFQDGTIRRRLTVTGSDLDRDSFRELTEIAMREGFRP
jgi:hypothetical protein